MLSEGIQAYVTADSGVKAQLGTKSSRADSTDGMFPTLAPSSCSMPYIVFQQVGGSPLEEMFEGTGRLQSSRWRFSCYGTTYKQAKTLSKFLNLAMISFNGVQGTSEIQGCWLRLEADDSESIPHGTIYACHRDYEVNVS